MMVFWLYPRRMLFFAKIMRFHVYLADGGIGDDDPEVAAAAHDVLRRVHRVDEVDEHLRALVAAAISRERETLSEMEGQQ